MSNPVPVGWTKTTIGKLTSKNSLFNDGDWVESKDQDPAGLNRLIQLADVGDGKFVDKSSRYLNDEQFDRLNCTRLQKGDILIARMPDPLGRACMFPLDGGKFATVVDIAIIRTPNADHYWLMSAINSSEFRFQIELNASGTTRTRIARGALSQISLVAPPLPEQQKIASILTAVDDVIESTQAQINKLKDLKTGMMQELLTKGIGHAEFKDSPVGRIPKGWEVVSFKDVFKDYKYGPRFSSKDYDSDGNVRTIRGTDVSSSEGINYQQAPKAKIDQGIVEAHALKHGDLVMITTADCGLTAVFHEQDIPYIASAYAIKLTPTNKIDSEFVMYFMQTSNALVQIESFIRKGTVSNLPGSDVMTLLIPLPPIVEQKNIVSALMGLDNQISLIKAKIQINECLKKSLMQDLLTGKVRVKVN
jgi:type I restriction enzyme, S subunit